MIRTRVTWPLLRFTGFWRRRSEKAPLTPVSTMRGFWGLMRAYWFSDQWLEAWSLTAAVAVITIISSKTGVWLTKAAGELADSIAYFHLASQANALTSLLINAGLLVLLVVIKDLGIGGALDMCNKTLHRKWRAWLNGRFNSAVLDGNHSHYHIQHPGRGADGTSLPPPDNIDQRIHESIKDMTGGAIGLASGAFGAVSAFVIYGYELCQQLTIQRNRAPPKRRRDHRRT